MNKTKAIYALYPTVTTVRELEGVYTAETIDGTEVTLDMSAVDTKANELAAAEPLLTLRTARNEKLIASDWTQGADVPEAIKTPYATYRQALRDITETYQSTDDDGFAWPEEPTV